MYSYFIDYYYTDYLLDYDFRSGGNMYSRFSGQCGRFEFTSGHFELVKLVII